MGVGWVVVVVVVVVVVSAGSVTLLTSYQLSSRHSLAASRVQQRVERVQPAGSRTNIIKYFSDQQRFHPPAASQQ